jgi:predicted TIM-barrel fold metal-dependent hydrolase
MPTMGLNAVAGKPQEQWSMEPTRFTDMIPGCYDPAERAKDMLADGIRASVCFPTLPRFGGVLFLNFEDKPLADACVKAYNDFLLDEWCAAAPQLFVPMTIGQLWDPPAFAAEIRRNAARGARAITFPENTVPLGLPSYFTNHWDPVWEACVETDTVVCMHIGTSGSVPNPSPDGPYIVSIALANVNAFVASVNLMLSPIPRRYPDLKFVFSEGGVGWVPAALERADRQFLKHRLWAEMADQSLPSVVFRRQMWVCMIDEPVGIQFRHHVGVDRILWESDYPHADTTWPHSQQEAAEVFAGLPDDEVEAITHRNAERLFRWQMAPLPASV